MPGEMITPNRIVIAAHPLMKGANQLTNEIAEFLKQHGIQVSHGLLSDEILRTAVIEGEFDAMIALGGDGTMLRAGHLCGPSEIPILGINLGSFGFLMEIKDKNWRDLLPQLLEGKYWLEKRMMLCTEQWREDQQLGKWQVVNEAVVSRGKMLRPVHLDTYVDGRYLTTYVADGIIASTPTGSTAYALAAGGPILPPELRNILLVAVAPHLSLDRAIVLAEGSSVSVYVYSDYPAVLAIDGQEPIELANGDRVECCASEHTLQFIRFQDPDYFYRNLTAHMNQNPSIGNYR